MSRLLAARDKQGVTDQELSDQVAVLLLAGGETTSAALVWSLHLLAGHPEVLDALHAEVDAVLGGGVAGWEHLSRLDLTSRVVREALRLYPPAWIVIRTCERETRLAGRTLPVGSMLLFSSYVLHRRPSFFPRPHQFDPGRWLELADGRSGRGAGGVAASHRSSFLPFGAGATKCIGEEFGLAEATLALASICARWKLTPEPGHTASPAARAVLCRGLCPCGCPPEQLPDESPRSSFRPRDFPDVAGADSVGFQNSATGVDLGFYAARSYSWRRPPRTGRRLIRSWERSAMGWSGRGGAAALYRFRTRRRRRELRFGQMSMLGQDRGLRLFASCI